jgi:hypothetical protein
VKESQITHLEGGVHLCLELVYAVLIGASDHKVIDVDPHDKVVRASVTKIDGVLGTVPLEPSLIRDSSSLAYQVRGALHKLYKALTRCSA